MRALREARERMNRPVDDEEEKEDFLVDLGGNEKSANDSKDKGKYQ